MNAEQANLIGKMVTESALDFLASKYNTTAQVIADLVKARHENVSRQFFKLIELGLNEAIAHVG